MYREFHSTLVCPAMIDPSSSALENHSLPEIPGENRPLAKRKKKKRTGANQPLAKANGAEKSAAPASPKMESPNYLPRVFDDPEFLTPRVFWILLVVLSFSGVVSRSIGLASEDLWFDEVQTYIEAIWNRPQGSAHWLFYPIVKMFLTLVPDPTLGARLYPALMGMLTIPLMGVVAGRLLGRVGGIIAPLLVLIQPFHLIYSQEARFYAPMMFFATALIGSAVLLAMECKWYRWLGIPGAIASSWLLLSHHPASAPVALFVLGWFVLSIGLSRWGFLLVSSYITPLKRLKYPRLFMLAMGVMVLIAGYFYAGPLREKAVEAVFRTPWGTTPNVDLTLAFFSSHFREFGWAVPYLGAIASFLLCAMGIVVLFLRRPWFGILTLGAIASTFAAIFAINYEKVYLLKYSCAMQPFFVLATATGVAAFFKFISSQRQFKSKAGLLFGMFCAMIVAGPIAPLSSYYKGYKMPLRPQLSWVNKNASGPAQVYIHGHVGYLGMLYADTLNEEHTLHYMSWEKRKDDGRAEVELLRGMAATGSPTYFAHAWRHDMPSVLLSFLNEECEEVAYFPPAVEPAQAGHLYRIHPTEEDPALGLPLVSIDYTRSPDMTTDGQLIFDYAAEVDFAVDLEKGKQYLVTVRGTVKATRPWVLAIKTEGSHPVFLPLLDKNENEDFEVTGVLATGERSDRLSLSHVFDDPGVPTGQGGLLIDEVFIQILGEGEEVRGAAGFSLGSTINLLTEPGNWESLPSGVWKREPDKERDEGVTFRLSDLKAKSPHLVRQLGSVRAGEMLYAQTAIRPREIPGYGGNAQIWFLNGSGQVIRRHFLASPSWDFRYPKAMMESLMLPGEGLRWYEGIRQVPPGAEAAVIAYPLWEVAGRNHAEGENHLEIIHLEYASGLPQAVKSTGE